MLAVEIAVLFSIVVAAQNVGQSPSGGQIRGRVVDQADFEIPASVTVIRTDSGVVVARIRADGAGDFQTEAISPGSYSVRASQPGFQRSEVPGVTVRAGETTDLGSIRMYLAGCDAPGVSCDHVFPADSDSIPWEKAVVGTAILNMKLMCAVDFDDKGKLYCPEPTDRRASRNIDMRLTKYGDGLYLSAANGAAMSIPNSAHGDCRDAKYGEASLRVIGLGPGVDFCVRSKLGAVSHVFFVEDVERDSSEVKLWHVTRKP